MIAHSAGLAINYQLSTLNHPFTSPYKESQS